MGYTVGQLKVEGSNTNVVAGTCVMTTAGTYAANDFIGVDHTPITFANCAGDEGGGGLITRCMAYDYAIQSVAAELWLFDASPAGLPDDNAAFALTDASNCIGVIPISTYYSAVNFSISPAIPSFPISFICAAGSKSLYGVVVTRGAPVYTSSDLVFRLSIIQD